MIQWIAQNYEVALACALYLLTRVVIPFAFGWVLGAARAERRGKQ